MSDNMALLVWLGIGVCVVLLTVYYTDWLRDEGAFIIPVFGAPLWPALLMMLLASKVSKAGIRRRERRVELARQREREEYEARRLLAKEGLDL